MYLILKDLSKNNMNYEPGVMSASFSNEAVRVNQCLRDGAIVFRLDSLQQVACIDVTTKDVMVA